MGGETCAHAPGYERGGRPRRLSAHWFFSLEWPRFLCSGAFNNERYSPPQKKRERALENDLGQYFVQKTQLWGCTISAGGPRQASARRRSHLERIKPIAGKPASTTKFSSAYRRGLGRAKPPQAKKPLRRQASAYNLTPLGAGLPALRPPSARRRRSERGRKPRPAAVARREILACGREP